MRIFVTGGAGFIGSAVVRQLIRDTDHEVVVVDKLTYAGNLLVLESVKSHPRYRFELADIKDAEKMEALFSQYTPDAMMHLAAESHVDRSIDGPAEFIQTNIVGTYTLLEKTRNYLQRHPEKAEHFRFHHVSTDEVYGSLGETGLFTEQTPYDPSSPYSASKAASDHLVRAWQRTFKVPTIVTNCSNNYGPFQFPEKLIPLMITKCLSGEPLPVYGRGENIRDWLYVEDHASALITVLERGRVGETYNIGGNSERKNIDVVHAICDTLDRLRPKEKSKSYRNQIAFVTDRPGHDMRYAIDASKLQRELGWSPAQTFETRLEETIQWYLDHPEFVDQVRSAGYVGQRLGVR